MKLTARSLRAVGPLFAALAAAAMMQLASAVPASADIAMTIPALSQQDPAWGAAPLGSSATDTIASSGCAITAVSMMLRYYGISTDPAALNAWLTANGGYAFDDDLIWAAVTTYTGGAVVFSDWTGPDLGLIHNELDAGHPVIAEVRLEGNQHFVLIAGYNSKAGLQIDDPWFGDIVNFADRYGDPATGIVSIRTFETVDPDLAHASWLATRIAQLHLGQ